jgi:hypothetical protein
MECSDDADLAVAARDRATRCTKVSNVAHRTVLEELSGEVYLSAYKAAFKSALQAAQQQAAAECTKTTLLTD